MAINLAYETDFYTRKIEACRANAKRAERIAAALQREDVQTALKRIPDAASLSAIVDSDSGHVTITAYVGLPNDPVIADLADGCDGEAYLLHAEQVLLETPEVRVDAYLDGRWPLSEDDREVLRTIGKLQTEVTTREYLACAA